MRKLINFCLALALLSPSPALAQTGATQLAHGPLIQRPTACKVSRGEVYYVTDDPGDGQGPGATQCGPLDNQWRRIGWATNLDAVTDVTVASPATGHVLVFDGSLWVNRALTKSDVGLSSVDNTSDANKPVSTATQAALDAKANKAGDTFTGDVGIGSAPTTGLYVARGTDFSGQLSPGLPANLQINAWFRNTTNKDFYTAFQSGSTVETRNYLAFFDRAGAYRWLTGKNASAVWILYDAATVGSSHRLWLETSDPANTNHSGNSFLNATGTGVVRLNYDPFEDNAATGGFEVWTGGALASNAQMFRVLGPGSAQSGAGVWFNTGATLNNQVLFSSTSTAPAPSAGGSAGFVINNFNGNTGLLLKKLSTGSGNYLAVEDSAGNSFLSVVSSGRVGVGTNNPGSPLAVSGSVSSTDLQVLSHSSASTGLTTDFGALALNNTNATNGNYTSILSRSGGTYYGGIQFLHKTHSNPFKSAIVFSTINGSSYAERVRIDEDGNLKVGGSGARATTGGTNQLVLFNGTPPAGALTNGVSLYSDAGELKVMDAAGNATLLSPHDPETNEWIYLSCNTKTGRCLRIDMERAMHVLERLSGEKIITEWREVPQRPGPSRRRSRRR